MRRLTLRQRGDVERRLVSGSVTRKKLDRRRERVRGGQHAAGRKRARNVRADARIR